MSFGSLAPFHLTQAPFGLHRPAGHPMGSPAPGPTVNLAPYPMYPAATMPVGSPYSFMPLATSPAYPAPTLAAKHPYPGATAALASPKAAKRSKVSAQSSSPTTATTTTTSGGSKTTRIRRKQLMDAIPREIEQTTRMLRAYQIRYCQRRGYDRLKPIPAHFTRVVQLSFGPELQSLGLATASPGLPQLLPTATVAYNPDQLGAATRLVQPGPIGAADSTGFSSPLTAPPSVGSSSGPPAHLTDHLSMHQDDKAISPLSRSKQTSALIKGLFEAREANYRLAWCYLIRRAEVS
ncbi:hypothetical protein H4R35_002578 [Dimargaris xerosporica]|nr:hypothetical protein H4R35_002578 [Dimargaris xerosporica]